jgi:hypothetical protein
MPHIKDDPEYELSEKEFKDLLRCLAVGEYFGELIQRNGLDNLTGAYNTAKVFGRVSKENQRIPFSELAMHTGVAGAVITGIAAHKRGTSATVTYIKSDGKCGSLDGGMSEVVKPSLARYLRAVLDGEEFEKAWRKPL